MSLNVELGRDADNHLWWQWNPALSHHLPSHPLRSVPWNIGPRKEHELWSQKDRVQSPAFLISTPVWPWETTFYSEPQFLHLWDGESNTSDACRFWHLSCPYFCSLLMLFHCLRYLLYHLPKFLRLFSSSASSMELSLIILALNVFSLLHTPMARCTLTPTYIWSSHCGHILVFLAALGQGPNLRWLLYPSVLTPIPTQYEWLITCRCVWLHSSIHSTIIQ